MDVVEALAKRHSVRAFLPKSVDKGKLEAIFEAAMRTPSWGNSQPWEVFVATGETLEAVKRAYAESYANKATASLEVPMPKTWTEAAIERRERLQPDMRRDCGDAAKQFGKLNQTMFDAPAVIYLCLDKVLSGWSLFDIGAYAQSVMLAATEQGLGTIPAMTLALFPEVLHRELGVPDNLKIVIGIAIGYADEQNKINDAITARDSIDRNVRILE